MKQHITLLRLSGAFLVYFFCTFLPPLLYLFYLSRTATYIDLTSSFIAKSHLLVIASFTSGVLIYVNRLKITKSLFGILDFRLFVKGALLSLIAAPIVLLFKGALFLLLKHYFHITEEAEQLIAERFLDLLIQKEYIYFSLLAIAISIFGPLVEEILFRGFLQGWLMEKGFKWAAIWITTLIFTLFHFEATLGLQNIELLLPLFVMGFLLSYLRERTQSLLSPLGLHIGFNTLGSILLFYNADSIFGG